MSSVLNPEAYSSHPVRLEVFHYRVSDDVIQIVKGALVDAYKDVLKVFVEGEIKLVDSAYNPQRGQYNAEMLLRHLITCKRRDAGLWVVSKDVYASGMNFVFGLAQPFNGAVLSVYRLSDKGLIEKEAVHEVGHVLGLSHCNNSCVMQYSNSLWEAKSKPLCLCEECRRKIKFLSFY